MVFEKLLFLNSSKAPGPDNLHPHLLKSYALSLYKPIQQSLITRELPNYWKSAIYVISLLSLRKATNYTQVIIDQSVLPHK